MNKYICMHIGRYLCTCKVFVWVPLSKIPDFVITRPYSGVRGLAISAIYTYIYDETLSTSIRL